MKLSLNWLKEFVEVTEEPRQLRTDLTNLGLGVESFAEAGDDCVVEVEVTTNRPDCLSHYGVAREVSTLYRRPLKPLEVRVAESGKLAKSAVSIEIADPDLCARYSGRVVLDVEVKPSPAWLARRLETVGLRPINNVADVTNYVLMELGHPLHAFDLGRLRQHKIIVRRARPGEFLRTLDGVGRTLAAENLVIADGERAVALAGVMGGEDSEISASTRSVLLESAWFDPVSIRRTSKGQGMHTEASHRFERGADIEMAPVALERATQLIAEVAGGEVLQGVVDVYPAPQRRQAVVLRLSEIVRILGAEIPPPEAERIFKSLGFAVRRGKEEGWLVTPPSFRLDIEREVDLIEELARHYGYDRLPARLRAASRRVESENLREKELAVSSLLVSLGFHEIITSTMVDPQENAHFTDRPPVLLANPLSQEASSLRSTMVPSMLEALRWNLDRGRDDVRLFEFGKTYTAHALRSEAPASLPEERRVLMLGLAGNRRDASVHESARPLDFFDLKGDLEALFEVFDLPGLSFEAEGCNYYEAGLAGRFVMAGQPLALFGRLGGEFPRLWKLRLDVWLGEVDLERLLRSPFRPRSFQPFLKFPAVLRDFSLLVPAGTSYSRLAEAISSAGLEEIQRYRPVERLPEGSIAPGHYSLLLRVTFQRPTGNLTGEEIAEASRRLLEALQKLGVRQRG